ncbi:trifunctional histidinol dehydrogenase [Ciborinia camelliae]|nr:trifunctional histidinol dehydrogenase [Ciborinia camelliae]
MINGIRNHRLSTRIAGNESELGDLAQKVTEIMTKWEPMGWGPFRFWSGTKYSALSIHALFSDERLLRAKIMEEAEELCDAKEKKDIAFEAAFYSQVWYLLGSVSHALSAKASNNLI